MIVILHAISLARCHQSYQNLLHKSMSVFRVLDGWYYPKLQQIKTMRTLLTPFSFLKSGNIYLWKASGSYNKTQNTKHKIAYTICDSKREGLENDEFQDIPQVLSTYGGRMGVDVGVVGIHQMNVAMQRFMI